ncbi:MAG: DKNYY domain-containing protein [Gemmataceae bacterium]|nr:DKNYY domain-containing protein [Gemmataceae bacterium]MCI0741598.1 DKNYY domain-containing protein [Gemmataceae bacterium]
MHWKRWPNILAALGDQLRWMCRLFIGYKGYRKVDGQWAYVTYSVNGPSVRKIDADAGSFQVLADAMHAKDKDQVFFRGDGIQGADAATFRLIRMTLYAKDKDRAYFWGNAIQDADAASFRLLSTRGYAKDNDHVFLLQHKIRGADPRSFKVIRPLYSRDATRVYCGTLPMNVAHIEKFEPVPVRGDGLEYTYEDKRLFQNAYGDEFAGIEVSKEQPVIAGTGWARDGEYYYCGPSRVVGADYASFQVLRSHAAADKNTEFIGRFTKTAWEERAR